MFFGNAIPPTLSPWAVSGWTLIPPPKHLQDIHVLALANQPSPPFWFRNENASKGSPMRQSPIFPLGCRGCKDYNIT